MTLLEVMVALFLVSIAVLGAGPMFMYAAQNQATGRDQGLLGALAVEQMEELYFEEYSDLPAGGSIESTDEDYSDWEQGFLVRWLIEDLDTPPNTKRITVRVFAPQQLEGPQRATTLATLRARGVD